MDYEGEFENKDTVKGNYKSNKGDEFDEQGQFELKIT